MVEGGEILSCAAREIGYHRDSDGKSKYGEWFARELEHRTGGKESGNDYITAPYCMMFVQEMYHIAGLDLPCFTASCGELLRWYRKNQPECITKDPIQGCIVIFDFPNTKYDTDHTGLFVKQENGKITTIDGNTSNGNDSNGGWVQQRTRTWGYANPTFIRPRGLVLVDWDKAISEMTDEQAYKLYSKAVNHMATLPLPTSWNAKEELDEAKAMGITDGNAPMCPATRLQTAVMVKRAVKKK